MCKYKNQIKFTGDKNWSPYQCKTFIKLAFVVHKNPKTKNITEDEQIAKLQHAGNVSPDSEIFFSEITTQTELDKIFENPDSSSLNGSSNFTLIEGAPGIGKTVVANEIACRWAQETKTMLLNIKLLLLICSRETNISQITSFKELMLHCYGEDEEAASSCAEYFIRTQGKNLMIIFDGYDEMATEEQKKHDTIFKRLLHKNSLPECHLVVTSRPYVTAHLHQHCNCRVEIMGFTDNDRLEYFEENLSSEQCIFVTKFLQEHLIIDSLCYIPLNLMSFLKLIEHTTNKDELPKTQTKLTEHTVRLTIKRNVEKKENIVGTTSSLQGEEIEGIIKSLASFAYKMLNKEKLVFSENELKRAGIDDDKYGLLRAVQIDTMDRQRKKFYSFVHFSVQEYLAAYHLSKRFDIVQSFELDHKFHNDKYFGVWRMYTGLTGGDKFPLQKFLSNQFYLTASLKYLFGIKFPGIHKKFKDNKITYLRLYEMFLEAPKSKIKEHLVDVITSDTLNLSEQNFTSDDMGMLAYFVARSYITQQWKLISLSDCNIDDDRLHTFKHKLCIEDGRKKPIIKELDISGNCNIHKLNTIIEFITKCNFIISLKASRIFKDKFNTVIDAVSNYYCNKKLQFLDLSENNLQNDNVHHLCNALVHCKNLKELNLSKNEIDDGATGFLAKAIVQWDKLQKLKIIGKTFSDDSNKLIEFVIAHHLECNSQVTMSPDSEMPHESQRKIMTMSRESEISSDSSSYTKETKTLDFKGQTEDIKYFIALLGYTNDVLPKNSTYIDCISQLLKLSLECVQSEGIALTKNASVFFKDHIKNLEEINLSGLAISEESAEAMAFSKKLQRIKMNSCKLSSKAAVLIANRLKIAGSIEEIELCNNSIDDEATEGLVAAFLYCNYLERFDYTENNFSKKTELLFEFLLPHLKFSGLSLDLSGNLDNMSSFVTLLGYIKEVPTDKSCYVKSISKITKLNLNCLNHQTDTPLRLTVTSSGGFQIFNCLQSLNINGIIIHEEIANHLVKVFENNSQLQKLFMNKCQITSPTIKIFCRQLKFNSKLKVFELSENSVDDKAIEELAIAILHWNLLESIKIDKNRFSGHGMLLLGILTKDMKPEMTLHFGNNSSVIKSFMKLLDYASTITGVRVTQFFNNLIKITELSMEVKTQVKLTVNASLSLKILRNLVSLNISGVVITEEVANNLSDLFNENIVSLKHLILNDCGLNSNTVKIFADKLKLAARIEDVQFCNNKIDDNATKSLAITILHWKTLRAIELEKNHFTNDSILIFDMLRNFPNTFIDFNGSLDKIIPFITLLGYMADIDSVLVEEVSKTQKLLLDCSELNNTKLNVQFEINASRFFTRFVSLTHLNISRMRISKEVADNLAKALDSNLCSLEHLIMNNCQLTSVNSINIIKTLRKCVKMRELQLSNNFMDDEVAEDLVVSILHLNALEILSLVKNRFSKKHEGAFYLLTSNLKFSDSKIDISNDIDNVISFLILLEYMTIISVNVSQFVDNISKVRSLNLDCSIQNAKSEELELTCEASQFFQRFQLTNLNLSGIHVTGAVVDNICKAFGADLHHLEYLFMNNCKLKSETVTVFVQKLQNAKHLKEIELCDNDIDDEATEALAIAILHWNLLNSIKLENNHFTENSTILFEILKEFLRICNTCIDFNGRIDKIIPFITLLGYMADIDIKNSVLVEEVSKTQKLLLDCSELNNTKLNVQFEINASRFFTRFVSLTHLNISGMGISKEVADNLAKALDSNLCSLEHLIMNNCQLTSVNSINIIKTLRKCVKMRKLQLSNNFIDDEVTEDLVVSILHLNALEILSLVKNRFSKKHEGAFYLLTNNLKFSDSKIDISNDIDNVISFLILLEYMTIISVNVSQFVDNISKVRSLNLDQNANIDIKNSILVEDVSKTQKLLLDCSELNNTNVQFKMNASKFFTRFVSLTHLNISGIGISKEVADNLAKALDSNLCSLEHLVMNDCQLTSVKVFDVIKRLQNCEKMRELQLSNNSIDDEVTELLVVTMFCCKTFEMLAYNGNNFSKKTELLFKFLLSHLKFSDLSLDLSGSLNSTSCFIILLGYMKEVPTDKSCYVKNISKIKKLNLNCLNHQTGTPLMLTVTLSGGFQIFNCLQSLNINGIIIHEEIANHLVKVFENNSQLQKLFMNKCQITSQTIKIFCRQLKFNSNLKVFELSNNSVDDKAIEEIAIAILHWNLLEQLKIDIKRFSDHGMLLLRILTKDMKPEMTLHFGKNSFVIKSFIKLLDYASTITGVRVTQFFNNLIKITELSMEVKTQVKLTVNASVSLKKLRSLVSLNVSGVVIRDQVANNLCELFNENIMSLKYLIMNDCGLNTNTVTKFADKLKLATTIVDVQFCNNKIDDNATKSLAIAILHWKTLRTIKLENNHFSNGSIVIFDVLRNFPNMFIDFNGRTDKIIPFITLLGYMADIDIKNSVLVEDVSKTQKLLLDCSELNNIDVQFEVNASKFFIRFVSLTHLNISGMGISKEVADNLAKALDSNLCSLEHLIMNNCKLTSGNSIIIIKKLRKCVKMRELHLSNNRLDNVATEELVVSILHLNQLELLTIEKNCFSDTHQKVLHFLVNNLKFSECEIDFNGGAIAFIILLEYMSMVSVNVSDFVHNISKIEHLSLDCSKQSTIHQQLEITPKASDFFKRFKLTTLNLSGIHITEKVINNNCEPFGADLTSVKYLLMNNCKLTSTSLMKLMKVLQNAKHIKEIELCNNELDDEAMESLVEGILHCNLLEHVTTKDNNFTEHSTKVLEVLNEFLKFCDTLIDFNGRTDQIIPFITLLGYMADVDIKNSVLVEDVSKTQKLLLDCSELNNIDVQFEVNASRFFIRFVSLTHLNISGMGISKEVADNLARALDSNLCSLEHLIMNNCQLTSVKVFNVIKGLQNCEKMRELQLSNNSIDDKVTELLVVTMFCCKTFEMLAYKGNHFSKKTELLFEFLLPHLKFSDLSLDLSGSLDNVSSFISLLGCMKEVPTDKSCYVKNISKITELKLNCLDHKTTGTPLKLTVTYFVRRISDI